MSILKYLEDASEFEVDLDKPVEDEPVYHTDELSNVAVVASTTHLLGYARALEVAGHEVSVFVTSRKLLENWSGILRPAYCPAHTPVPRDHQLLITNDWTVAQSNNNGLIRVSYMKLTDKLPAGIYRIEVSIPSSRRFTGYAIVEPRLLPCNMGPSISGAVTYIITHSECSDSNLNSFTPLVEVNDKLANDTESPECHTTLPALLARLTEPTPFALPWVFHFVRVSGAAQALHPLPPGFIASIYYWSDIRRSADGARSVSVRDTWNESIAWAVGWGRTLSRARRDAQARAGQLGTIPGLWAYWRADSGAVSDAAIALLDEQGML